MPVNAASGVTALNGSGLPLPFFLRFGSNAGHGLDYHNVQPVAAIPEVVELNIGHAIVARAVMAGFGPAVAEMKRLMAGARGGVPA